MIIGVLVVMMILIVSIPQRDKPDNRKVIQIERAIMANSDNISKFNSQKKKEILDLIEIIFSKRSQDENLTKLIMLLSENTSIQ